MTRKLTTTGAIVVRRYAFRESDRIVVLLSEQLGLVKAMAKGQRRSKKRFGGIVDLLNCLEVEIQHRKSEIQLLTGARLLESYPALGLSPMILAAACYLAELASAFAAEGQPEPRIFAALTGGLRELDRGAEPAMVSRVLELRVLAAAGLAPRLDVCTLTGRKLNEDEKVAVEPAHGGAVCLRKATADAPRIAGVTRKLMMQTMAIGDEQAWSLPWTREELMEARAALRDVIGYHLGRPLKARAFAEAAARFRRERKEPENMAGKEPPE